MKITWFTFYLPLGSLFIALGAALGATVNPWLGALTIPGVAMILCIFTQINSEKKELEVVPHRNVELENPPVEVRVES
jgi:hypothetical protein